MFRKVSRFFQLLREHVAPKSLLQVIEEVATSEIAEKIVADAAFVTHDIHQLYDYLALFVSADGFNFEFGVFKGKSINYLATKLPGEMHGFDSFEGLPSGGGVWEKYFKEKSFDLRGELPQVEPNVELHKGWIFDTLPEFIRSNAIDKVSFIHIDTDIYESAKCILENLEPFICSGTVILFDELCNYHGFYLHEYQAFKQYLKRSGQRYEILGVCCSAPLHGSFAKVALRIV